MKNEKNSLNELDKKFNSVGGFDSLHEQFDSHIKAFPMRKFVGIFYTEREPCKESPSGFAVRVKTEWFDTDKNKLTLVDREYDGAGITAYSFIDINGNNLRYEV